MTIHRTTSGKNAIEVLSLDGDWAVRRLATGETWPAQVPGCVHTDLARAGLLPSMSYRDNEATQQWIDGEDWIYRRTFELNEDQLRTSGHELVCNGLDTLASVSINDVVVLETDNMYRTWRTPVGPHLRKGENVVEITFRSTLPVLAEGRAKRPLSEWNIYFDRHKSRGYVRKMPCSYGWDWGPVAATAGIWKDIRLEFTRAARWQDVHLRQEHSENGVTLNVKWKSEGHGSVTLQLWREGALVVEKTVESGAGAAAIVVEDPQLWWPSGLGAQPLYDFRAFLRDSAGKEDVWQRRIGLRSLRLVREADAIGQTFCFEINGRPMFCKGANWVPVRVLLPEITEEHYRTLLQDTVAANMNMLRVWGGGIYEHDIFYDLCDELGILVWQDFMFSCGMYPSWDDEFLKNVEAEAEDNVRRIRHHPSLALWCGNNELEQGFAGSPEWSWEEYGRLFDQLLPKVCAEFDPDTAYWPASPHTPIGDRTDFESDLSGDTHHWTVFFGRKPYESQRTWRTRFMSEFGFQSYPELRTVESFTTPEDRFLMSRILDYRQRSPAGNQTIFSYLVDWFQPPLRFEDLLTFSQISQALCVRYATEHLRRLQPICSGVLYWQINDVWPCASWSSIDSHGRWKALHYDARRFFAPVLVSIEEDLATYQARIHVSNQRMSEAALNVRWQLTDTDGKVLLEDSSSVKVDAQSGLYVADLDATPYLKTYYAYDLMIWAWVEEGGEVLSRNWVPLSRPKHLSLADPHVRAEVRETAGSTHIHLCCDKPAPYVVLGLKQDDARFSDNFFNLHPGESRTIEVTQGPAVTAIREQLVVRSLADWMPARQAGEALKPKPADYEPPRK